MPQQIEINAVLRHDVGKGASRRLRRLADKVPGIIYGGKENAVALTMNSNDLVNVMKNEAFFSQILNVVVDGKGQQAVVRDLQRNPINERVLHVDFMRISADRAMQVSVPLRFVGEDDCVGVLGGGIISHALNDVEISCLPANLPEYIEVFVAELDVNESIHLSELALPEGVTIPSLVHEARDVTVVSVQTPRIVLEEEEELAAAAEGEEGVEPGEAPEGDAADEGAGEESSDE